MQSADVRGTLWGERQQPQGHADESVPDNDKETRLDEAKGTDWGRQERIPWSEWHLNWSLSGKNELNTESLRKDIPSESHSMCKDPEEGEQSIGYGWRQNQGPGMTGTSRLKKAFTLWGLLKTIQGSFQQGVPSFKTSKWNLRASAPTFPFLINLVSIEFFSPSVLINTFGKKKLSGRQLSKFKSHRILKLGVASRVSWAISVPPSPWGNWGVPRPRPLSSETAHGGLHVLSLVLFLPGTLWKLLSSFSV